jgi:phage gp29-like protein
MSNPANRRDVRIWANQNESYSLPPYLGSEVARIKRHRGSVSQLVNRLLPNPDDILRKAGKKIQDLRDLMSDAHTWACVQSRKSGVLALEWEVTGPDEKQVGFVRDLLEKLDMNWVVAQMLDTPLYGYTVHEVMWRINFSGHIVPYEVTAKPSEWFGFDENGNCVFKTIENPDGEALPNRKFLVVQHNPTYTNPYGESVLAKCWWPLLFKKQLMKFGLIFAEKYGMPYLVGKYPEHASQDEVDEVFDGLLNMVRDGVFTVPTTFDVSILEAAKTPSVDVFTRFIVMFNAEISKAILSQTLTTEQGDTGSYAMSQTHLMVRKDVVDADRRLVEKSVNELIRWIIDLNFAGVTVYPTFRLFEEEQVDLTRVQRDTQLWASGWVKPTKDYIQRAYNLSDTDFEMVDKLAAPAGGGFPYASETVEDAAKRISTEPSVASPIASGQPAPTRTVPAVAAKPTIKSSQQLVKEYADKHADAEALDAVMQEMMVPVVELITQGANYSEVGDRVFELFPHLATEKLEELIAQSMFAAQLIGEVSA